ncbi:uncharacterized protein LOC124360485 [Homalodisca vitripennis]|uniref:uncharacterized protein LOC124360485 n=1 Tax=Homalodisca vitripennis TaxID=197043 RepID=UPI001EE9D5B0|nr:uncharacterized protein LOC124360485 [Homalodisca vitripennis]
MGKKAGMRQYTTLSEIDHKMQFINVVAVINSISPTIKRSKLFEVVLEVSDATMYNPGFVVKLLMKSEILSEFLVTGKKGLIVELQEIKVIKNEGMVYGEVRAKEELKLYNDKASCIKWFSDEELHPVSDEVRCSIKDLSQWKKMHFTETLTTEDFTDDSRRSRLSNPQSNQVITSNVLERNSMNNINNSPNISPEKRFTDVKTQNNIIFGKRKKNSLKTAHSSDFDHSKSASLKRDVEQIKQTQQLKKSGGKVLSKSNVHGERQISKRNSSAATRDEFSNNSGINVNPEQEKNTKSKSSKHVKNNDLSPDSVSEKSVSSEGNIITLSKITLIRCDSPKINENIKSVPKKSKKYSSSTNEQKETETNISTLKNNVNEEKQILESENIVESSNKSVRVNEKSLKNKESPIARLVLSKKENSGKDDSLRSPTRKKNISIDNVNKIIGDKNGSSKSDGMSDKSGNTPNCEKNNENVIEEPRKHQCMSDGSDVESDNSKRTNHENVNKQLRKRQYASDGNKIESDVSKRSKQNISSPLRKVIKNTRNLKKKSSSLESSLNLSEISVTNRKTPALNSSDSSVSNSERSFDDPLSDRTGTQVVSDMQIMKNVSKNYNTSSRLTKDDKRKLTRSSMTKLNSPLLDPVDEFEKLNSVFLCLKSITRKVNFKQVESLNDISMCNLEEIDVPDKFDLECKVISEFTLIEDNIQVIRVQDGSLSKKTLIIPECSSWEGVIEMILNNPTVKENSPFVDIIIFDCHRMDKSIKAGDYFRLRNVMAVKFCLKFDPRINADKKGELFFCLEGQNSYVRGLNQTTRNEINRRLEEDGYKSVWNETFHDLNAEKRSLSPTLETVNIGNDKSISSPEDSIRNHELHETGSPKTRKRKLDDSEIKNKDDTFKTPKNSSDQVEVLTEENIEPQGCNIQDAEGSTNQLKVNSTTSSDETVLGETPALLRELREIMHEESVIGMPLTSTEDIHLKNTGSEITYSQFRTGADEKMLNFRTSTQLDSISQVEAVVPNNCEEVTQTEECSRMEPLVYCPSGSSLCSGREVSPLKDKTVPEDPKCQEECSESILNNYKTGQNLDVESNTTPFEYWNCNR